MSAGVLTFGPVVAPTTYVGARPVPEGWQERLESIVPRSDHRSWLWIRWESGDPWSPVSRWVIWQIRPLTITRPEIVRELQGPHPRSTGHYCGSADFVGKIDCLCRRKENRWVGGAARLIDRGTWEVYQETGGYGTRWWAVQGPPGGHRYRLDAWESKISRVRGGPNDTPAIGDLPYLDFDERVVEKIIPYDNVRQWKHIMDYAHKHPEKLDEIERQGVIEAQAEMWKWLESQVSRTMGELTNRQVNALRDHARDMTPIGTKQDRPVEDPDQIRHDFIHSS
jgi:hypothetical protein